MTSVSITQLKANPAAVLLSAGDYPVSVQNRNKTAGYVVGKDLFEKMILLLEDVEDRKKIALIDLDDKGDFEEFAEELGI